MGQSDDWNKYQLLVLHQLDELRSDVKSLIEVQSNQNLTIEGLKLKSGFIATISGILTAIGVYFTEYLYNKS